MRKIIWLEHVKTILYAITLAVIIRGFIFEIFSIPSGSMKDTLLTGDRILVTKYSYGFGPFSTIVPLPIDKRIFFIQPKRGDIIVFRSPHDNDPKEFYIKRLIGLPGDKIQVRDRILYINDKAVKLTPDGQFSDEERNEVLERFIEENPEMVQYHVLYDSKVKEEDFPNTTPVYEVPQGYYFFMGDNRNKSVDSRYLSNIGFVHELRLIGKAQYILFNGSILYNIVHLFRGERTLVDVNKIA
jgi:signal peptidase I